ncbi:MAG: endo-1,4-beta-xylanase [Clostridia bacterium]|nr:endo-1,4-beta-xylanase [Clostridia bacterium]
MEKQKKMERVINKFDSFKYFLDKKIDRDIEENRKGQFVLNFKDLEGNPIENLKVKVRQVSHEFKFGCNLFQLEQFSDTERNEKYKEAFKKIFNYAVVPFYWDTLEPTEGKPRFDKDSEFISRRPPIDTIVEFCEKNNIETKGHCLVYNSFQPEWIPERNRELKRKIDRRIKAISERYSDRIFDFDVINEMFTIYKNCYKGNGARNMQIADERDHEKWSFDMCRRYFPNARLFWNEGIEESLGQHYRGYRSFYYMTLTKMLSEGVPIDGIGMQYHAFDFNMDYCNPLRIIDALECYGEFGLPIHISEISIPSYSNDSYNEQLQAEITKRLFKLWFSQKPCEAIVWWNMVDNTAYKTENIFKSGLLREDCTPKQAYKEIENLICNEWVTSFNETVSGQLRFSGFYGEYEIEAEYNGKTVVKNINLFRDNTGYDNRLLDFRSKDIIL